MSERKLNPKSIVAKYAANARSKTAGEVRFIKDRSDDAEGWAFAPPSASAREPAAADFKYDKESMKPLSICLEAVNGSQALALKAMAEFSQMPSRTVSGDGLLGGKGYIQSVQEMRKKLTNVAEALSAVSDTLRDEVSAPHWAALSRELSDDDAEDIQENIDDADDIADDPESWATEKLEE